MPVSSPGRWRYFGGHRNDGYSVTIGEETIHGDLCTAPRLTARGKRIHRALRQLQNFTETRDHVLDHIAAQQKPLP